MSKFAGDYFSNVIDVVDYFIMEIGYQADINNPVTQLMNSLQASVRTHIILLLLNINFNLFTISNYIWINFRRSLRIKQC